MIVLGVAGCAAQTAPLEYVSSTAVQELPQLHQQQIATTLVKFYGTPSNPTLKTPDMEAETESGVIPLVDQIDPRRLKLGAEVYQRRCAGCHGVTGDGNGEAAAHLVPKPRDYRKGIFKFTSTGYGNQPRRADLVRTLRRGAKGTSMPGFPLLPDDEINAVIDYVIVLSHRGQLEGALAREAEDYEPEEEIEVEILGPESADLIERRWKLASELTVLPLTVQPQRTEETISAGRLAFLSRGCASCHGQDGKGQTDWLSSEFIAAQEALPEDQRIKINYDDWGHVAPAADLTAGMLHGGRRPIDIYRRIYSGINGTPMPAFSQALAQEPDTIWHLTHFVMALVEGRELGPPPTIPPTTEIQPAAEPQPAAETPQAVEAESEPAPAEAPLGESAVEEPTKPEPPKVPNDNSTNSEAPPEPEDNATSGA